MVSFKRLLVALLIPFNLLAMTGEKVYEREPVHINLVNSDELHFPKNFLFGFAIAAAQNDAEDPNSMWTRWQQTTWPDGTPHIEDGQRSGRACDHWNLYKEDIRIMKQDFNANTFRFSIAWSRVEPREGEFSREALQHYSQEVDALLAAGIVPMITLHHFDHPIWFEDKGAFEKEENIKYFVRFSQEVFRVLGSKVPLWCTINEPTIYMFQTYLPFNPKFPPGTGKKHSKFFPFPAFPLASKVLRNLLQAHAETYRALKAMPNGDRAQIGLVHQYLKFEAYRWWNPGDQFMPVVMNKLMVNAVIDFLQTGLYSDGIPLYYREEYRAPEGKLSDFIGLNYYSRVLVDVFRGDSVAAEDEVMTDMPYALHPQGLYLAIKDISRLKLPIYVTENGTADNQENDYRRMKFFKEYLKMVSLAIEDGYDVRGYYCWTLCDNFEWDMGYKPQFGVYSVNRETQERKMKKGARVYARIIKAALEGSLTSHTSDYLLGIKEGSLPAQV